MKGDIEKEINNDIPNENQPIDTYGNQVKEERKMSAISFSHNTNLEDCKVSLASIDLRQSKIIPKLKEGCILLNNFNIIIDNPSLGNIQIKKEVSDIKNDIINLLPVPEIPERRSSSNKMFIIIEPQDAKERQEKEKNVPKKKSEKKNDKKSEKKPEKNPVAKPPSSNTIGLKEYAEESEVIIDEKTIKSAKKLKIIVLESSSIKPGTIIYINAGGLLNSTRNTRDGFSYFGTEPITVINYYIKY